MLISSNSFSYNSEPKTFISELVNDATKTLSDKSISKAEKAKKIEIIALEHVDINAIGLYTLGSVRKNLDQETLKRYQELFQKYFLKTLTSRLTDYSSNKFEVISAEQKSDTTTIVFSKILKSSSQPEIKIEWRVYAKDPTKPLIRDLRVEGLSLARTQKEEFASILNSNKDDINILFSKLEEFIKN
ncbi:ABC transporter substrate-binding protein [Pelagibacteraceae bacterium]|nr:ABC transporter substrate-binding protein [Pelagibacteraceae bacterium]